MTPVILEVEDILHHLSPPMIYKGLSTRSLKFNGERISVIKAGYLVSRNTFNSLSIVVTQSALYSTMGLTMTPISFSDSQFLDIVLERNDNGLFRMMSFRGESVSVGTMNGYLRTDVFRRSELTASSLIIWNWWF